MSEGEQSYRREMVFAVCAGLEYVHEADVNPAAEHPPRIREGRGIKAVRAEGGTGRGHRHTLEYVAVELWDGTIYDVRVSKRKRP